MILLNVSQKSKLQLFLHWTNYPSANKDEHDICLGNAPTEAFKAMLSNERKLDMFLEESPFKYDSELDKAIFTKDVYRKERLDWPDPAKPYVKKHRYDPY